MQGSFADLETLIIAIKESKYEGFFYSKEKPLLYAKLPQDQKQNQKAEEIIFEEFESKGDGNCGFYVLGLSRSETEKILLSKSEEKEVRQHLSAEIINELKSGSLGLAETKKSKALYAEYKAIQADQVQFEEKANKIINEKYPDTERMGLTKLITFLSKTDYDDSEDLFTEATELPKRSRKNDGEIKDYCASKEMYVSYVINSLGKNGWLGYKSAWLMAKYKQFNLHIWRKSSSSSTKLELIDQHRQTDSEVIYHILHTDGFTHFNLLATAKQKAVLAKKKLILEEKLEIKPFKWDENTLSEVKDYIIDGLYIDQIILKMAATGIHESDIEKMENTGKLPKAKRRPLNPQEEDSLKKLKDATEFIKLLTAQNEFSLDSLDAVNSMIEKMVFIDEKQSKLPVIFENFNKLRSIHKNYVKNFLSNIIDTFKEEDKGKVYKKTIKLLYDIDFDYKYSESEIKQRFKILSPHFHSDQIRNKKYSFFSDFVTLYNEVFSILSDLQNIMCDKLKSFSDFKYCLKKGDNSFKKMCEAKTDLSLQCKAFFDQSYHFYVDARRKADETKNVRGQIEVRQKLAELFLERAKIFDASLNLDAQLYVLASMKLAYELLSGRELKEALEKSEIIMKKINNKGKEEKIEVKPMVDFENKMFTDSIVPVESKNSIISAENSGALITYRIPKTVTEFKTVFQEEVPKKFFSVVLSNKNLVEYTLNKRTLTSYSKLSAIEKAKGQILKIGGKYGGPVVSFAQLIEAYGAFMSTSVTFGPLPPLAWGVLGAIGAIAIWKKGSELYEKGSKMNERVEEAKIIARNIEYAMECYEQEKFDQFLDILSANINWPNVYLLQDLPSEQDLLNSNAKFYRSYILMRSTPDTIYFVSANDNHELHLTKKMAKNPENLKKIFNEIFVKDYNEPLHKLISSKLFSKLYEEIILIEGQAGKMVNTQEFRLLSLDDDQPWIINTESFIDRLIKYGFRPDGVAHLLNLIAQILLSGRLSLKSMNDNIFVAAENILGQIIEDKDRQLFKHASAIDEKVHDREPKIIFNNVFDQFLEKGMYILNSKSYYYHFYYGEETVKASQQLKIVNRLNIETNIARINLALLLLTKVGISDSTVNELQARKKSVVIQKINNLISDVIHSMENIKLDDYSEIVQCRLELIKNLVEVFGYQLTSQDESKKEKPILVDSKMAKIQKCHHIRKIQLSSSEEIGCIILPVNRSPDSLLEAINKSLSVQGYDTIITRDQLASQLLEQSRTDIRLSKLLREQFKVEDHKDYINLSQSILIEEDIFSHSHRYLCLIAHLLYSEIQIYEINDDNTLLTNVEKFRPVNVSCSITISIAKLALDEKNSEYHFVGLEIHSDKQLLILNRKISQTQEHLEILELYRQRGEFYRLKAQESAKYHYTLESQKNWELCIQDYERLIESKPLLLSIYSYYVEGLVALSRFELAINVLDTLSPEIKSQERGEYYYLRSIVLLKKNDLLKAERALNMAEELYRTHNQWDSEKQQQVSLKRNWINQVKKRISSPSKLIAEYKDHKGFIASETKMNSKKTFNILSIDGGGIRGIIPAVILCEVEKRIGRPLASTFELIAGTSTGGIISAGLSTPEKNGKQPKYSAFDILELYTSKGKTIFSEKRSWISSLWNPLYKVKPLRNLLIEYFGVATLSDVVTDLLITAVDCRKQDQTFFFNSKKVKTGDQKNHLLWQAARATSAAPTFFEPFSLDDHHFVDGGVTTNNPAQSAFTHALESGFKPQDIFLLSLGTGRYAPDPLNPNRYSGKLFWAQNLCHIALSAQEEDCHRGLLRSFKAGLFNHYQRMQPDLPEPIPLDGVSDSEIPMLVETALAYIEEDDAQDNSQLHTIARRFGA